jgi:hypothetical protein
MKVTSLFSFLKKQKVSSIKYSTPTSIKHTLKVQDIQPKKLYPAEYQPHN